MSLWTPHETNRLSNMAASGLSAAQIAKRLGRSRNAVMGRVARVRIRLSRNSVNTDHAQEIFAGCYPTIRRIILDVAIETCIPFDLMLSRSRVRPIMLARRTMIWTIARDTKFSMALIGAQLRLDHTTIMHAVRRKNEETGENVRGTGSTKGKREAQERYRVKRAAMRHEARQ